VSKPGNLLTNMKVSIEVIKDLARAAWLGRRQELVAADADAVCAMTTEI
jgi:hypothetical protein